MKQIITKFINRNRKVWELQQMFGVDFSDNCKAKR